MNPDPNPTSTYRYMCRAREPWLPLVSRTGAYVQAVHVARDHEANQPRGMQRLDGHVRQRGPRLPPIHPTHAERLPKRFRVSPRERQAVGPRTWSSGSSVEGSASPLACSVHMPFGPAREASWESAASESNTRLWVHAPAAYHESQGCQQRWRCQHPCAPPPLRLV